MEAEHIYRGDFDYYFCPIALVLGKVVASFVFCLLMAYLSERLFGVACFLCKYRAFRYDTENDAHYCFVYSDTCYCGNYDKGHRVRSGCKDVQSHQCKRIGVGMVSRGAVAAVEAGEDITGHYDELSNVRREHRS